MRTWLIGLAIGRRPAARLLGTTAVIGPLDDIVVVALCLRYAGRQVPRDILLTAWPGEPRLMERLLGRPRQPEPEPERSA